MSRLSSVLAPRRDSRHKETADQFDALLFELERLSVVTQAQLEQLARPLEPGSVADSSVARGSFVSFGFR